LRQNEFVTALFRGGGERRMSEAAKATFADAPSILPIRMRLRQPIDPVRTQWGASPSAAFTLLSRVTRKDYSVVRANVY
jgi:hypothetical protein